MASLNPEPERIAMQWAIAWERQIILEILRDTEPAHELSALLRRLQQRQIRNVSPAFPSPSQLAAIAVQRYAHGQPNLERSITRAVEVELSEATSILENDGLCTLYDRLVLLIQPEILFLGPDGRFVGADTQSEYWGLWYPGLDSADVSMQSVLETLPGVQEGSIPMEVRLFEDPTIEVALPGAVSLAWHDIIHILLGRGLLDQDEAFVVGFAMGNSSSFRSEDAALLRHAFSHSYPEPFRVHGPKLLAFDLGIEAGREIGLPDLAKQEGSLSTHASLQQWRDQLGISTESLRGFYARERAMIPKTLESARLPI
jgi:hypothetical protein